MHNQIKSISKTDDELRVGNYMILFGGKDLTGEFFTKNTVIESAYTRSGVLHVDFEHGLDPDRVGIGSDDVLGVVDWKSAKIDDKGIFVERVLKRQANYMDIIEEMIDEGLIGTSSMAVPSGTKKTKDGEILAWPLMRDSLTFTPAEPRMLKENLLTAAKSLYEVFPYSKSLSRIVNKADVKSMIDAATSIKEIETLLREAGGFSRADATGLVARIKALSQSESVDEKRPVIDLKQLLEGRRLPV
jgi:hypothetical protein